LSVSIENVGAGNGNNNGNAGALNGNGSGNHRGMGELPRVTGKVRKVTQPEAMEISPQLPC